MKKAKALKIMLQIVNECEKHGESGCGRECAFGDGKSSCLVSDGNDIPTTWRINQCVNKWMRGEENDE